MHSISVLQCECGSPRLAAAVLDAAMQPGWHVRCACDKWCTACSGFDEHMHSQTAGLGQSATIGWGVVINFVTVWARGCNAFEAAAACTQLHLVAVCMLW